MSGNVMIDEWYPVGLVSQLDPQGRKTALIEVRLGEDGNAKVTGGNGRALPASIGYGPVWSSLGDPQKPLFAIPEADQPGRRLVDVGVVCVRCSPLRAVENFLDIAPFSVRPYRRIGGRTARGPEPQGRDPRGRGRGLGDPSEVLSAASREVGGRRHNDGIHISRARADLLDPLRAGRLTLSPTRLMWPSEWVRCSIQIWSRHGLGQSPACYVPHPRTSNGAVGPGRSTSCAPTICSSFHGVTASLWHPIVTVSLSRPAQARKHGAYSSRSRPGR